MLLPVILFISATTASAGEIRLFTESTTQKDTLTAYLIIDDATSQHIILPLTRQKENYFLLSYSSDEPVSISIFDGKNRIAGVFENNDEVTIHYRYEDFLSSFKATGRGAAKYTPDRKPEIREKTAAFAAQAAASANADSVLIALNHYQQEIITGLQKRDITSKTAAAILYGEYISLFNYAKRRLLAKLFPDKPLTLLMKSDEPSPYLKKEIAGLLAFDSTLYHSPSYTNDVYYCLMQEYMLLKLLKYVPGDVEDKYHFYLSKLPGKKLRERVLLILLEGDFRQLNDSDALTEIIKKYYMETEGTMYDNYAYALIARYGNLFRRGETAPAFALTDTAGKTVTLADLQGHVVVLDFWYASCAPCLAFFEQIKEMKKKYSDKKVIFLNISIDKKEKWLAAIKKLQLNGYNVYTSDRESAHPVIGDYQVNGYPTVCIIDKKGNIYNASPPIGNSEQLKKQIDDALSAL